MSEECCPICKEETTETEKYTIPECNHWFHTDCIMAWYRHGNNKCPMCRDSGMSCRYNMENIKFIRNYARRKDAPKQLKAYVEKIRKAEAKLKQLSAEIREFNNSIPSEKTVKEILKDSRKHRDKVYRIKNTIWKLKRGLMTFNVQQILIVKKIKVE